MGPRPDGERSPLFAHLNADKRSVVADVGAADGRRIVDSLLAGADLVVESAGPNAPDGYHPSELRSRHPHLVVTSVTPFGCTGPYAGLPGNDLIAYAMGGPMHATGLAEREPIKLAGRIVEYQCGAVAALASLAAVTVAETSGSGSHVDVSNFETQAGSIDRRMALLLRHIFTGRIGEREGGNRIGVVPAGIYPTADGYCQIVFAPNWMDRVSAMLDHPELSERLAAPDWMDDPDIPELMSEAMFTWTVQRTKQEAMDEAQSMGLAVMTPTSASVATGPRSSIPSSGPTRRRAHSSISATPGDRRPAHRCSARTPTRCATTHPRPAAAPPPTHLACPSRVSGCSISAWCGPDPSPPPCWATSEPR
jgi:crotonobetainyl-CoA:carnitine CoA-transferase CaiB-like acyl-CoA transferase